MVSQNNRSIQAHMPACSLPARLPVWLEAAAAPAPSEQDAPGLNLDQDFDGDGSVEILFGDSTGWVGIIEYTVAKKFALLGYLAPDDIGGTTPTRIHDLEIANMDGDSWEEILWLSQITADDTLSTTRLQIIEMARTRRRYPKGVPSYTSSSQRLMVVLEFCQQQPRSQR